MKRQSSVAELKKELAIREKTASVISTKIDKLEASIVRLKKQRDEILGEKSVMTKAGRRKVKQIRRKRGKSKGGISLKSMLVKVLKAAGKPQNVDQIVIRLKKSGYRTAAKDIKKQVGVRLYTGKEFVKTAPGIFTLKSKATKAGKKVKKVKTVKTVRKVKKVAKKASKKSASAAQ